MEETARQRATAALRVHAPELADVAVLELGHGLDNTAFVAGDLVLRVADGCSMIREARLLQVVAQQVSIPVPAPRFVDEDGGVLVYPLIPGRPLLGRAPAPGAALRLGRFLRDLHSIDPAVVTALVPAEDADPDEWLEDLDGPPDLVSLLHATVPPPARRRVVAHADLGAEHILDLDGRLTGIIDWSDAAVTDPALDFARLYRDFGPVFLSEALDAYGGVDDVEAAMARIEFFARCAAIEDLAYGRDSGRSEYTHAAEHSITWLFRRSR
ncbi:MAG: phosphotransferase [Actinomycetota bacterium]|nr:phosphotransferase [Actinomycetota bacterium]